MTASLSENRGGFVIRTEPGFFFVFFFFFFFFFGYNQILFVGLGWWRIGKNGVDIYGCLLIKLKVLPSAKIHAFTQLKSPQNVIHFTCCILEKLSRKMPAFSSILAVFNFTVNPGHA